MLREIAEIEKAYTDGYNKEVELRTRWEDDFDKWRLEPYDRGKDYKSFTGNQPRTLADLIIDFLVRSKIQVRIPIDKELEPEKENLSNAERLLIGLLKLNDLRLGGMVQPSLLGAMAWHSVVRGWYVLRAFITKGKDGATRPRIDVWDRLHTQYEIGADGPLWVCHTRPATAAQIKAEYNIDIGGQKSVLYDFWDDEVNYIHVKGYDKFLKQEKHGLKRNPCRVIASGATPFIESTKHEDTIKNVGESWLAANRDIVEPLNELYSDILTIYSRAAKMPMKGYNVKQMEGSPYKLDKGQAALIHLKRSENKDVDQDIVPFMEFATPKDVNLLMGLFGVLWQEGGVPESVYGQMPFQLSGYAISRLQEALGKAINNGLQAIQDGGDWLLRELLLQFSEGGFKAVKVEGRDSKDQYFGPVDLKPADIKGDWFPEFKLTPRLPEDEMERYAMARIAREGEEPMLSAQTTNDRILKVQDPDLEEDLKLEEWVKRLPPVRLRRAARKMQERGRPDLAQEIMAMLGQVKPEGGGSPSTEAVQPEFTTGVPPQVMPPEQLGRTPENERLARLGMVRGR